MQRRTILKGITAAAAAPAAVMELMQAVSQAAEADAERPLPRFDPQAESVRGDMRYRKLGRTGEVVSLVGIGGYHIGSVAEDEGVKIVRSAVDRGVTFMDNCWDYLGGESERRMGKALQDGYREKVFLMTKIDGRTRKAAAEQIDQCLSRLKTDRIDLMQHHEIIRMEGPDRVFAEGGAMEAVLAAKQAGKIRFIGFTGHKDPLVHLRMLEVAKEHDFHFDAVQMPLNVMDAHFRSFAHQVVPELVRQRVGVLAMKTLGAGTIPRSNTATATECLHYAMNLPVATVITGIDSMKILDQAIEAVKTFKPLGEEELKVLLARTADAAKHGRYERFKTDSGFDGTARNPAWLG